MAKTKHIEISKLVLNTGQLEGLPKNPRFIKDERFEKLKQSIEESPEMLELRELIVVESNGKYVVIAGNMRLRAGRELKMKTMPCKVLASDTDVKKIREYATKDNVPFGEVDWDIMANEWDTEELEEWGLELPDAWDEEEVSAEDDAYEMPEKMQVDVVLGDLIEIGKHRLICGDSTDSEQVTRLMGGNEACIVFTDPDYSMDNDSLFACYSNTIGIYKKASFWVTADKQAVSLAANDIENFSSFFIHNFKVPTLISNTRAMQRHNMICVFGNSSIINRKDGFTTIVDVATERTLESHKVTRMAKRVELPAEFITHFTEKSDLIVDIFCHSGSTMVAAHQLGRKCYGMELEPKYCQVIIDRMRKLDEGIEVKINGERYE